MYYIQKIKQQGSTNETWSWWKPRGGFLYYFAGEVSVKIEVVGEVRRSPPGQLFRERQSLEEAFHAVKSADVVTIEEETSSDSISILSDGILNIFTSNIYVQLLITMKWKELLQNQTIA